MSINLNEKKVLNPAFYYMRNDEKRVAVLAIDNGVVTLDGEASVEGSAPSQVTFTELDKALNKVFSDDAKHVNAETLKSNADAMRNAENMLDAIRNNANYTAISYKIETVNETTFKVTKRETMKLFPFSNIEISPLDFSDVRKAIVSYDVNPKQFNGRMLNDAIVKFYNDNGLSIDCSAKRLYVAKHCISNKYNPVKGKFTSATRNDDICYAMVCAEDILA